MYESMQLGSNDPISGEVVATDFYKVKCNSCHMKERCMQKIGGPSAKAGIETKVNTRENSCTSMRVNLVIAADPSAVMRFPKERSLYACIPEMRNLKPHHPASMSTVEDSIKEPHLRLHPD